MGRQLKLRQRERGATVPGGDYILALVEFQRRASRTDGRPWLRCVMQVVHGPKAGALFTVPWSLDTSRPGTLRRWEIWMEQVGRVEEVDLDNDAEIAEAFMGRAFKASVRLEDTGDYEQNDIHRLVYPRLYTAGERQVIEQWNEQWQQRPEGH